MKIESFYAIRFFGFFFLLASASAAPAPDRKLIEIQEAELKQYLRDFYEDSYGAMERIPVKRDESGNPAGEEGLFPPGSIEEREFVHAKDEARGRIVRGSATSRFFSLPSAPESNDLVENLVESPNLIRTLKEMEDSGFLKKELDRKPWSDSYWPLAKGLAAARYADPRFPSSGSPERNMEYILSNPASALIAGGRADILAPTEKYDYLVGDDAYTYTGRAWDLVRSSGQIAGWAGICDGWSGSAVTFDEPIRAVTVTGAEGRTVRFYPSDIKGLSAMLFAKGAVQTRFIGSRCAISKPERDAVGRVQAPECADNNAGTWHLSVVNQLGAASRPLIIDATYDYQIWNFPVWRYRYSYFNPQTLQPSASWSGAVAPIDRFTIDKFRKYRSPEARYVAGISMSVTYSIENRASHGEGPRMSSRSVHYIYDVELDAGMRIVGGEWYTNIHPDFTWFPRSNSRAVSVGDAELGDPGAWTGSGPMPEAWSRAAHVASLRLQPLAAIVETLVKLSSSGGS